MRLQVLELEKGAYTVYVPQNTVSELEFRSKKTFESLFHQLYSSYIYIQNVHPYMFRIQSHTF